MRSVLKEKEKNWISRSEIDHKSENRYILPDLIRITFFSFVVTSHIAGFLNHSIGGFFGIKNFYWVTLGGIGVTFYIILSAFLLEIRYGNKKYSYYQFIIKRIRRIYPIYWIALIISILITMGIGNADLVAAHFRYPTNIMMSITGTYAFFGLWGGPILGTSWFVGLIIVLYLCFPVLSRAISKYPVSTFLFMFLVSILSRIVTGTLDILPNRPLDWLITNRIFEFCLGIYLARRKVFVTVLKYNFGSLRFRKIISHLSEMSFPAYLIHYPLLPVLHIYKQIAPLFLSIIFYLTTTYIMSFFIL